MFSGLVREIAKVKEYQNNILSIESAYTPSIGDSIAVNGMCLTVIETQKWGFKLEISAHSAKKVAIENYKGMVHIEPALRADSRLDGHFVQGHIDYIGEIVAITPQSNQTLLTIKPPKHALALIIPQGSITIDGISLTIASVTSENFSLTIIPHTMQNTLFHTYKVGRRVNIETDVIVRSIAHVLQKQGLVGRGFGADSRGLDSGVSDSGGALESASWSEIDDILMRY